MKETRRGCEEDGYRGVLRPLEISKRLMFASFKVLRMEHIASELSPTKLQITGPLATSHHAVSRLKLGVKVLT